MQNVPSVENQTTDPNPNPNDYPVYPEQEGEWDRPINPYGPH
jgi:hypothetical protein